MPAIGFRVSHGGQWLYPIGRSIVPNRSATITEWPPKWFLKWSPAERSLWCIVLFWLFFVIRAPCSGGNSVMDWLMKIRSMIRVLVNRGFS